MDRLPRWADVVLVPLVSLLLAAIHLGPGAALHRAKPGRGVQRHGRRRARLGLRLGLYALLHHQLHLHRPCGDHRLPCRPFQHRRRGAGAARRPRRGAGLPLDRLAALDAGAGGRDGRRGGLRRGLGGDPGLSAGQARQPYRHHHDHVQLHRGGAAGLSSGRRPAPGRADGPGLGPLPGRREAADLHGPDHRRFPGAERLHR